MTNTTLSSQRTGMTRKQRERMWTGIRMLVTLPFVAIIMIPLLYTLMMSLLPPDELYSRFWPTHADFNSYLQVFTRTTSSTPSSWPDRSPSCRWSPAPWRLSPSPS